MRRASLVAKAGVADSGMDHVGNANHFSESSFDDPRLDLLVAQMKIVGRMALGFFSDSSHRICLLTGSQG